MTFKTRKVELDRITSRSRNGFTWTCLSVGVSIPVRKHSVVAADVGSPSGTVKKVHYDTSTRDSLTRMCSTEESPVVSCGLMWWG